MNKPRLIDANELKKIHCSIMCGQEPCPEPCETIAVIDKCPTAYDIDEIVEQMTMESLCATDCEYLGKLVCLEDAIEIVKGGVT